VIAAVESASQLRSPRLEEHDLRGHRRKLTGLLFGSLVLAGVSAWLLDATIVIMTPDTASKTSQHHIELVDEYLQQRPLERLSFMLDQQRLTRYVQSKAPEVAALSISGDNMFARHSVSVTERQPLAQWKLGNDIYVVDAEGVAYQETAINTAGLIQVKDETGLPLASQKVASRNTMQFIGRVVSQLQAQGAGKVAEIILPAGQLKEIDVVMENRPYRIKLHTDRAPVGQATDVLRALQHLDSQGTTPAYIDARVEGKAFYR
jgi:cell division septal protein FtsQ